MRVFPVYTIHARLPGPSVHSFLAPPPPLPPAVFPAPTPSCVHIELPHTMRWALPGKFTSNVEFDGWRVAKDGHDTGTAILHAAVPMNAGLVLTILFSKYKILFSSGSVQANGSPVGTFFPVIAPPQFCCSPCSLPAIAVPLNNLVPFPNTVGVGMALSDFLAGWAAVIIESAIDLFFTFLFAGPNPFAKAAEKIAAALAESLKAGFKAAAVTLKAIVKAVLPKLWEKFKQDLLKKVVVSIVKGIIAYVTSGKGGRIDLPIVGVGIAFNPHTGEISVGTPGNPKAFGGFQTGEAHPSPAPTHAFGTPMPAGTPAAI